MSTYFSIFTCDSCRHRIDVGFVGDTKYTVAFCSHCTRAFRVAARPGQRLRESNIAHHLLIFGKHKIATLSKNGRRKKDITHWTWIESGIDIPVDEELVESGDILSIRYTLNYSEIACPACQERGTLVDFRDYTRRCPKCNLGRMEESDL